MKVKLLKKIRKRFKLKCLGFIKYNSTYPKTYWEVIDLQQGTEVEKWEHISHSCIGNMTRIYCPTIAEQLAMVLKGIMFVYNHRIRVATRKTKALNIKYKQTIKN